MVTATKATTRMIKNLKLLPFLGIATLVGCGGNGNSNNPTPPPATTVTAYSITKDGLLVSFDRERPNVSVGRRNISGLNTNETIRGMDLRPNGERLYVLTSENRLLQIDRNTGSTTATPALSTVPSGSIIGFDFNPVADRLRIISRNGQSLRVDVDTGAVTVDTPLTAGSAVVGVAYTDNRVGATTTTLYGINEETDSLVRIGGENGDPSPNLGEVTTIARLRTEDGEVFDATNTTAFDIAEGGFAYLLDKGAFYRVDLATGRLTSLGQVTTPTQTIGLTSIPADSQDE